MVPQLLRFSRRTVALFVAGMALAGASLSRLRSVTAQTFDSTGQPVASLKDQLEKGLRCRRQIEFQFVNRVVQLVDQGRLTREVVQGTYKFVVTKYRDRKYLVPIFELTLRKRLEQDGNRALANVPTTVTPVSQ